VTQIKMCGMTRAEDVAQAALVGADYVGCVFASGVRLQAAAQAAQLFAALDGPAAPRRVGVFASADTVEVGAIAGAVPLDVAQVHGDSVAATIGALQTTLPSLEIWSVVRCREGRLPAVAASLWRAAKTLLLDAHVPGMLGGTGVTLPWQALADDLQAVRAAVGPAARLVLAGGLTPDNVGSAIAALRPDIVDVSSGVERAPGIKDHGRMRAFAEAVRAADHAIASPLPRHRS
jgi:phosphoribosylanthranilate isomerase